MTRLKDAYEAEKQTAIEKERQACRDIVESMLERARVSPQWGQNEFLEALKQMIKQIDLRGIGQ